MNRKATFQNASRANKLFYIFNTLFWVIVMFIVLYPLYLVCIASVSDPDAVLRGEVIWKPVGFSLVGYKAVMKYSDFWRSYANTIFNTTISVCLSVVVTISGGYVLSRKKFPGKSFLGLYVLIPMFFSGGLIPTFLVVKDLGLYNTRAVLIFMGCVSVWNLMVARTYIENSIPQELYDAAVMDGVSHFQYLTKIVVPLSKTIIAVLVVYAGVAEWNDYFTGLVYIKDRELLPLQTVLREILATLQIDMSGDYMASMAENTASLQEATRVANVAKYCVIILSTGPVLALYAFVQKFFEKGVMIGSLKG